jgi:uncharacterized protein (TIGR03435 family)
MPRYNHALNLAFALSLSLYGQDSAASFEVATIKAAPPITAAMVTAGKMHVGTRVDSAQADIGYASLAELIQSAYHVKAYQVSGPDWLSDQRWDILAKMPAGATPSQVPQMLQALLAERFGLKVHREDRSRRVYALEVAPGGPRIKASPTENEKEGEGGDKPLQVSNSSDGKSTVVSGGSLGGITRTEMQPDGSMHLESSKMTIAMLADALSFYLDRPVVDLTQLTGSYVMELEFSAADLRYAAMKKGGAANSETAADSSRTVVLASEPAGASMVGSVQKLGLRLEPRQAPIETIVVDHVERTPTGN